MPAQADRRPARRWRLPVLSVLIVCGLATALYVHSARALRARFLMAVPDSIPADPALNAYAMARGAPAFATHCASCHGAHGQGDSARGIPDLRDHDWLYGSGRIIELERVVLYGIRSANSKGWKLASMPAYARTEPYKLYRLEPLSPAQLRDVTEYILSFQGRATDAQSIARGTKVFRGVERGLCWDCHGDRAQGNSAIGAPNLADDIWLYGDGSRESIYRSIAYGHGGSCPAWISRLSAVTIRAVAVYVHSLALAAPAPAPAPGGRQALHD
ncbi:MAG: c-type cytochrome [Steroidobacteraceae bacterium]|jgi:cytochrome c oxidase cbb3-type subunit 3